MWDADLAREQEKLEASLTWWAAQGIMLQIAQAPTRQVHALLAFINYIRNTALNGIVWDRPDEVSNFGANRRKAYPLKKEYGNSNP